MKAKTSKDNGRCTTETDTNATSAFRQLLCKAGTWMSDTRRYGEMLDVENKCS